MQLNEFLSRPGGHDTLDENYYKSINIMSLFIFGPEDQSIECIELVELKNTNALFANILLQWQLIGSQRRRDFEWWILALRMRIK